MPKQDTRGFGNDHMQYLVHHAQQFHKPDPWADEVQEHLNNFSKDAPKDPLASPEDQENATQSHQDQAIANVSDFGNSPNVLSPPKPKPLPSMAPPTT